MTALKKMMMKGPPKPPHSAARHQHNGDISRRLDIVPGDAQGSFQPFRPLAADPKTGPGRLAVPPGSLQPLHRGVALDDGAKIPELRLADGWSTPAAA
jgi:hypothetical protein